MIVNITKAGMLMSFTLAFSGLCLYNNKRYSFYAFEEHMNNGYPAILALVDSTRTTISEFIMSEVADIIFVHQQIYAEACILDKHHVN